LTTSADPQPPRRKSESVHLDRFLAEPDPWKALCLWLGLTPDVGRIPSKEDVGRALSQNLALLDRLLARQVNAIIHAPAFQRLEASWRGLRYLVEELPQGESIKVRVLNLTWKELNRDLERALEFDQSQLFRKIYSDEFGTPGGQPFGLVLGDYEIHPRPSEEQPTDDVGALVGLSAVAAAAFAPFIIGLHPSFLELDRFADLDRPMDLGKIFEQVDFLKWRAFRHSEDSRFVGLTLPRVLRRLPYRDDGTRDDRFRFREEVEDPTCECYLWGTAVYAFGAVVVRAFAESAWPAEIRGTPDGGLGGGLVPRLPSHGFATDRPGVAPRGPTDGVVTDALEKDLGELGFVPLVRVPDTELAVFYGNQSAQRPKKFDREGAEANAKLSTMLQYVLCVSRIAHYIKIMGRDKAGSFASADECQRYIQNWLNNLCIANENASAELKARHPLREASVEIREHPGKPGSYFSVIHLRPHYQLDQMVTGVRLATELAPAH
jgi:type VI secretion system ImpC/EvpB family protein